MNEIQRPTTGYGVSRRTGRQLHDLSEHTLLDIAGISAVADRQTAAVAAMTSVGAAGVHSVSVVAQIAQAAELLSPNAAAEINMVRTAVAMGVSQIVIDTANKVR